MSRGTMLEEHGSQKGKAHHLGTAGCRACGRLLMEQRGPTQVLPQSGPFVGFGKSNSLTGNDRWLGGMAPEVGLEPTTTRLTAACSTIELLWNAKRAAIYKSCCLSSTAFPASIGFAFAMARLWFAEAPVLPTLRKDDRRGHDRPGQRPAPGFIHAGDARQTGLPTLAFKRKAVCGFGRHHGRTVTVRRWCGKHLQNDAATTGDLSVERRAEVGDAWISV